VPPFAQPASADSNLLQVATLSPVGATDFPPGHAILRAMTGTAYSGALLGESLRPDAVLDGIPLIVTRICRAALGNAAAGQPQLWTVIEFEVPADRAPELAEALSRLLLEGSWYCDFRSAGEVFVVFGGRVFHYRRGDRAGRARAEEYGRSVGVPEAQLDWPS
jgi:hypothetical protein